MCASGRREGEVSLFIADAWRDLDPGARMSRPQHPVFLYHKELGTLPSGTCQGAKRVVDQRVRT